MNLASENVVAESLPPERGERAEAVRTNAARTEAAPISASSVSRITTGRAGTPKRKRAWGDVLIRAAFVLFLLLVWQGLYFWLVVRTGAWSSALFRSPLEVTRWMWDGFGLSYFTGDYQPSPGSPMPHSFWEAFKLASYPTAIGLSLLRLLEGYAIAVAIGFPLGLLVARFSRAEKTIGWLAISLQSLPSICWIPLAQLWFGRFGVWPILFVTIMGALFATVVAVSDGLANVPPLLARAGRTLGASGPRLYFGVLLPAALPAIVTGLKIGWSFAWRSLMAAELIVFAGGLGNLLKLIAATPIWKASWPRLL